ncbi:class I SAM-dependent RNA methyltransferase [Halobacteriovorax sp. RT-1-4]|uniref:class I SAM-dependent RNA methyltransferase n=1 Tax=unclassified Halobacteriovorax TaxID=2639665 RepID=UPI003999CF6E
MTKKKKPNKEIKFPKTFPIDFKVEHLDSLGQGVSKSNGIAFIQKTLPGEEGKALVYKSKKSIQFASLTELTKKSQLRTDSECPYYSECGGCHFLHTSYENEIEFKKKAYLDNFSRQFKIDLSESLIIHKADERYKYRNRIQLHYNKKDNSLGFFNDSNSKIITIKNCLMANDDINSELAVLHEDWQSDAKKSKGHVELFQRDGKILKTFDSYYSAEGFLQVNPPMNERLLTLVNEYMSKVTSNSSITVDLFGGSGNITKALSHRTVVMDATPTKFIKLQNKEHQEYFELDIYHHTAIKKLEEMAITEIDLLVIDPPRSGLKNIDEFTKILKPKHIVYVSCNNQTLARDTHKIQSEYRIEESHMFDFFPGTRHFESVIFFAHR